MSAESDALAMIQAMQREVSNSLWLYCQGRYEMGNEAAASFQAYSASLEIERRVAMMILDTVNLMNSVGL